MSITLATTTGPDALAVVGCLAIGWALNSLVDYILRSQAQKNYGRCRIFPRSDLL